MADRYWVGGTGNWDTTTTTHWSGTSGGAGGQSVPVDGDTVTLDGSSGGGTVTLTANAICKIFFMGSFTGTFNMNGYDFNCNYFSISGTGTRTLTLGSGTLILKGLTDYVDVFIATTTTNLTVTATTGTIKFMKHASDYGSWIFKGGGMTYGNIWFDKGFNGAVRDCAIIGANTFTDIKYTNDGNTYQANILRFQSGVTHTFSTFTQVGMTATTGMAIYSCGTTGSNSNATHTLSKASGTVTIEHTYLKYSVASGGATFNAINSFDEGNNTGWVISTLPTIFTLPTTLITETSFRGNGSITATGGANSTRRGICYKLGAGVPTTSDSVSYEDGDFGVATFYRDITL